MTLDATARSSDVMPSATVPRLAQVLGMARNAPQFLRRQARAHGPFVALRLGRGSVVLVTDPAAARAVLVDERTFPKGPGRAVGGNEVGESPLKAVLGNGLLTSKGEHHKRQRRLIQPAFHHERIASYAGAMAGEASTMTAGWRDGDIVDVHAAFAETTLRILTRTIFSSELTDRETATVRDAMHATMHGPGANVILVTISKRLGRRAMESRREAMAGVEALISRLIDDRRAAASGQDVLSWLLAAQDAETGYSMSDRDLRDEVLTLLLAGHETSTNALSWAYYLLSQNPAAAAALHAEVDSVLGDRLPTMDDLAKLHYTRAVADEAMRLFPPAWVLLRHTASEAAVGPHMVPAGTTILMSPFVTHRDPTLWTDAERFTPERWLTGPDGAYSPTPPTRHAYFPFGGGPRMCIGNTFALMEIALVLAATSARWQFDLKPGHRVGMTPRVTLRPRGGMPMIVRNRKAPGASIG
jgi:cytochrome P450